MASAQLANDATTISWNGRNYNDLMEGDFVVITPVNPATSHTRSRQGVNIQERSDKDVYDVVIRVQKYSDDELELNRIKDASPPEVLNGTIKENYVKDGEERVTTWRTEQGSITTQPTDTRNDLDGNSMMEYTIRFNRARRV